MKIVFASNYFNHHQKPFCDAMYGLVGDGFHFVETMPMEQERRNMGWGEETIPAYVKRTYIGNADLALCQQLIADADVVMYGSAPYSLVEPRLKAGKLTFKYSERIYKKGCPFYKLPWHFYLNTKKFQRYKNLYILCASAYTSADFAKTFTFLNKAYKWGYLTAVKRYEDLDGMIATKRPDSILWAGRMIPWKHPDHPLEIAKRLKAEGYDFNLRLIGNGELESAVAQQIQNNDLSDRVEMLGAMKPEEVRRYMEDSQIFLFTSDKNEGWGAVLNESMNSACAVVASHAIGSVPFLVKDGENGLIYKDGDLDDLYQKVKGLLDNQQERDRLAKQAYATMAEEWNPENAAKKLLQLFAEILNGNPRPFPFPEGVCSKAALLKDNWKK